MWETLLPAVQSLKVFHLSHYAYTTKGHLYSSGERNVAHRIAKVGFSKTMMQALYVYSYCGWSRLSMVKKSSLYHEF